MKFSALKVAASTLGLLFVASACRCGTDDVQAARGKIDLVWVDAEGQTQGGREAVYDFGSVFMSQTGTLKLTIANIGSGPLTVKSFEKVEGATVDIGANVDPDTAAGQKSVFNVAFTEPATVAQAGTVEIEATFSPPETDDITKPYEVRLLVRADGAEPGAETATIILKGNAESGVCELPAPIVRVLSDVSPAQDKWVLDFGSVAKGDKFQQDVPFRNPSPLPAEALITNIEGPDLTSYTFAPESIRGAVTLEPGQERNVSIVFAPQENRPYRAYVRMRASTECPVKIVDLIGQGVDSILSWEPSTLDCGYVTPGVTVTRDVTFTNHGNKDAQLSAIKSTIPNEFWVVPQGQDTLAVPGKGGTASLSVACKPASLGQRAGQLKFTTNLERQPAGQVPLKVYGGGPDIDTAPRTNLNFGKVAYFSGASVFQTRKLTILNVGTEPAVQNADGNLKLGKADAAGKYAAPYFKLEVVGSTQPGEFEATLANTYDPATGLIARVGKNAVDLVVKVTPKSLGKKEAKVTIYSNDPDEPETVVNISADAQAFPDCNYSVTPTNLNFGLLSPPASVDLEFKVKSLLPPGAGNCLISNLDIKSGSDAIFSLPAGRIDSKELAPGEELLVKVRAWPTGTLPTSLTNAGGFVELFAASTQKPQSQVELKATIGQSCLTVAPDTLNFGTVKRGCRSPSRTFSIYNTCPGAPVQLNSVTMQAAAGQPAGGPDCPGGAPCPEFVIDVNPVGGSPVTIAPGGAAVTFSARYSPIDYSQDTGAIALGVTQNGQPVTYIVTLEGKGDTDGQNVDTFTQDFKPKADILFVIDNSGSMSSIQAALAQNFTSFIQYAVSAKVDYQIAVISTDDPKFRGDGANPKILKPTTPDVQTKFAQKVVVGTSGSSTEKEFEPAVQALSAPLVTGDNAGFLRNDASLAVIAITDEEEQSGNTVTYWYNQLMNIKGFNKANLFTFNAIAWFQAPSCSTTRDNGRLSQMVQLTAGIKEEICTPNWAKTLEQLGKRAGGFKTNFFLTGTPDLARTPPAISVKIDGVDIPEIDPIRGARIWTYDSIANSVNFDPSYVPEPGQTLTITYYVTCNN